MNDGCGVGAPSERKNLTCPYWVLHNEIWRNATEDVRTFAFPGEKKTKKNKSLTLEDLGTFTTMHQRNFSLGLKNTALHICCRSDVCLISLHLKRLRTVDSFSFLSFLFLPSARFTEQSLNVCLGSCLVEKYLNRFSFCNVGQLTANFLFHNPPCAIFHLSSRSSAYD